MKLVRITTVPISLDKLITGQMKYMSSHGIDVTMISADGPEIDEVVEREQCPHIIVPLTRQITPVSDLLALWKMYRTIRSIQPDIVHTHTPKAGLIGMMASWIVRVPIRIHTVAGLPLHATSGLKLKVLTVVEKLTYACATKVLPNSSSLDKYIREHKLTSAAKLDMVGIGSSNGIDLEEFNPESLDEEILQGVKQSIEYNSRYRYLLFVGRVVADKGIVELVDAFNTLCEFQDDIKLIVVGPQEHALDPIPEDTLMKMDDNANIILMGYSDKVKYFMSIADLFVFPSHREGFPNVLLQAGAMNCPIVCSDIGGNLDIVENGIKGRIFTKGNVESLSSTISAALEHEVENQIMSANLSDWINTNLMRNRMHELIFNKYRSLYHTTNR